MYGKWFVIFGKQILQATSQVIFPVNFAHCVGMFQTIFSLFCLSFHFKIISEMLDIA